MNGTEKIILKILKSVNPDSDSGVAKDSVNN